MNFKGLNKTKSLLLVLSLLSFVVACSTKRGFKPGSVKRPGVVLDGKPQDDGSNTGSGTTGGDNGGQTNTDTGAVTQVGGELTENDQKALEEMKVVFNEFRDQEGLGLTLQELEKAANEVNAEAAKTILGLSAIKFTSTKPQETVGLQIKMFVTNTNPPGVVNVKALEPSDLIFEGEISIPSAGKTQVARIKVAPATVGYFAENDNALVYAACTGDNCSSVLLLVSLLRQDKVKIVAGYKFVDSVDSSGIAEMVYVGGSVGSAGQGGYLSYDSARANYKFVVGGDGDAATDAGGADAADEAASEAGVAAEAGSAELSTQAKGISLRGDQHPEQTTGAGAQGAASANTDLSAGGQPASHPDKATFQAETARANALAKQQAQQALEESKKKSATVNQAELEALARAESRAEAAELAKLKANQPGYTIDIDTAKANAIAKRKAQEAPVKGISLKGDQHPDFPAIRHQSIYEIESAKNAAAKKRLAQEALEQAQKDAARRNKEGELQQQPGYTIDIDTARANAIAKRKKAQEAAVDETANKQPKVYQQHRGSSADYVRPQPKVETLNSSEPQYPWSAP